MLLPFSNMHIRISVYSFVQKVIDIGTDCVLLDAAPLRSLILSCHCIVAGPENSLSRS